MAEYNNEYVDESIFNFLTPNIITTPSPSKAAKKRVARQDNGNAKRPILGKDVFDIINQIGLMDNTWNKINVNELVKDQPYKVYSIEKITTGRWPAVKVEIDGERNIFLPRRMVEAFDEKRIDMFNNFIQTGGNNLFIIWKGEKVLPGLNVTTNLFEFIM
jgi:hypothetical protein